MVFILVEIKFLGKVKFKVNYKLSVKVEFV